MKVTASSLAGSASSHVPTEWVAINWRLVQRNVRAMQHRLTKAIQEGDWRRAKALQRWLTHSFSAKALAVKRVTENQGKEPQAWTSSCGTQQRRSSLPLHS